MTKQLFGGTRTRGSPFYLLKRQRGFISVLVPEVVVHAEVRLPSQLVARLAVRDALDDSTLRKTRNHWRLGCVIRYKTYEITERKVVCLTTYSWSRGDHPVGEHVEIQTHQLEDVFKKADDLKGQHVLGRDKSHSKHNGWNNGDATQSSWGRGSDLSAVISHFKDGRLPVDPLGLLLAFHLVFRIWATLQPWGEEAIAYRLGSLTHLAPTFQAFSVSGTFFFQLTDSTLLYFKLGQVGSFSSTIQRQKLYFKKQLLQIILYLWICECDNGDEGPTSA